LQFRCSSPEATAAAARLLAAAIGDEGLVLSLVGPLGAGKTAFVKGLASGLGIAPASVSSPTFVIVNQYGGGRRALAHVDLYRLATSRELEDTGFLDLLEPGAVVAVEWGDRLPDALPADRLELHIERDASRERSRSFTASATGRSARRVLEAWERELRTARHGAGSECLLAGLEGVEIG
jgi:tRNA threonylcarbamoyladenosine biosynthesis protein TsaE